MTTKDGHWRVVEITADITTKRAVQGTQTWGNRIWRKVSGVRNFVQVHCHGTSHFTPREAFHHAHCQKHVSRLLVLDFGRTTNAKWN